MHGTPEAGGNISADNSLDHSIAFLANRHSLMVMIAGLVRNPILAEDLFQEVWIALDRAVKRGVVIEDTAKWCRGVARNLILHHWRDQRGAKIIYSERLVEMAEQAVEELGSDDVWISRRLALQECIRGLPEQARQILSLKYEQDLDTAGVARHLSKTVAAVKMTLSRLRALLFDCVRKKLASEESGL